MATILKQSESLGQPLKKISFSDDSVPKENKGKRSSGDQRGKNDYSKEHILSVGRLNFGPYYSPESNPFIMCRHDASAFDVLSIMQRQWKFDLPRFAVLILSDIGALGEWTSPRQLDDFKKGLIKAANTTHMWIFTNGLNCGIAKEIGEAVARENSWRRSRTCEKHPAKLSDEKPDLTLVGISREDLIQYAEKIVESPIEVIAREGVHVKLLNQGTSSEDNLYELNKDHSHFIIVRDDTVNKTGINQFTLRLERHLAARRVELSTEESMDAKDDGKDHSLRQSFISSIWMQLPMMAIVIQGDYSCAKLIFDRLQAGLPILIFDGTGGLANLLAFVYDEVNRRNPNTWDAEFIEDFLKPELATLLCQQHPFYREQLQARNAYRDKILDIVKLAWRKQFGAHLTVVYTKNHNCDLTKLDQILLQALFKYQRANQTFWRSQLTKDLILALDWNSPRVAMAEVFQKAGDTADRLIDFNIFFNALTRVNRETFVDLFIKRGFQLHKFLSVQRLQSLFRWVRDEEFFLRCCWQGALSHNLDCPLSIDFVEEELNTLIQIMTGLSGLVSSKIFTETEDIEPAAERRALVLLCLWALLTNRRKLVRILWQNSDEPVHLALILSMAYDNLHRYVHDENTNLELEKASKEYSELAVGVLDKSFKDSCCRAYDILSCQIEGWGGKTAVDIAAEARNMTFIAHPCCQKWITDLFMGNIALRDLPHLPFAIPTAFKIPLCAFLVFPMYFFVYFRTKSATSITKTEPEVDNSDFGVLKPEKNNAFHLLIPGQPTIWTMISDMWSAPITKFYVFQIFYILYLVVFSVAVLIPSCGDSRLHAVVCLWTLTISVEHCRRTYLIKRKYRTIGVKWKVMENIFMFIFVCLYAWSRVFTNSYPLSPYSSKVLQCLGLFFTYYSYSITYFALSPTLGPLLFQIKLMVLEDFVNFMRMAAVVIASNGIIVQALLFPDHPFGWKLLKDAFHRGWISLFLTPVDDLLDKAECKTTMVKGNSDCTTVSRYGDYTCPHTGFWPYIIMLQYLILIKLILMTLLYALFSNSTRRIQGATDNIWKFQRYEVLIDFESRLSLPSPFTIIVYIILPLRCLYRKLRCRSVFEGGASKDKFTISEKDFDYWRGVCQDFWQERKEEEDEQMQEEANMETVRVILDEIDTQKNKIKRLQGQMRELQRSLNQSKAAMEDIRLPAETPQVLGTGKGKLQTLSRRSPYPGTQVFRYPVADKYIQWTVMWIDYDPITYTRPKSSFPESLAQCVDEDLLLLTSKGVTLPTLVWNGVLTSPAGIVVDRTSWIPEGFQRFRQYRISQDGVPVNPIGRTGLRGKGGLPRWGPNHYVRFVISRWQKSGVYQVGGRGLEVMLFRVDSNEYNLPGDFVPGQDKYLFLKQLLKIKQDHPTTVEAVKELFHSMASNAGTKKGGVDDVPVEKTSIKTDIMTDYMDDPLNTDNCWKEYELWSIHFTPAVEDNLYVHLQASYTWRTVKDTIFAHLPPGDSILLNYAACSVYNRYQPPQAENTMP